MNASEQYITNLLNQRNELKRKYDILFDFVTHLAEKGDTETSRNIQFGADLILRKIRGDL